MSDILFTYIVQLYITPEDQNIWVSRKTAYMSQLLKIFCSIFELSNETVWGDMKYLNMTKTDVGNAHYPNYRKMHILEILNVCHLLLLYPCKRP